MWPLSPTCGQNSWHALATKNTMGVIGRTWSHYIRPYAGLGRETLSCTGCEQPAAPLSCPWRGHVVRNEGGLHSTSSKKLRPSVWPPARNRMLTEFCQPLKDTTHYLLLPHFCGESTINLIAATLNLNVSFSSDCFQQLVFILGFHGFH